MRSGILHKLLVVLLFTGYCHSLDAQQYAVKTNLVHWATTTPNLSVETSLNSHQTIELTLSFNPWEYGSKEKNKKIQHWIVRPELRHWFGETYNGHFVGAHAFFGRYNAGGVKLPLSILKNLEHTRYEGYGTGIGISYGYQWKLSSHWNLEATVGIGYTYFHYDRFECYHCGSYQGKDQTHYVGPTRLGLSIIYLL